MNRNWTKDQLNAIKARDGSLLVSAAAGSGKTAVLVERVIERLTDSDKPCDADKLLIVTFTRAATAEMRERIGKAINERLKQNPYNNHLKRQQILLPNAKICTIDSFCSDLVRENFHQLEITPDFQMLDNSEQKLLQEEAGSDIIEQLYQNDDEEFKNLVELLFKGRDDRELCDSIIRLYDYSMAYPFPSKWLERAENLYIQKMSLKDSEWGKIILKYINDAVLYYKEILNETLEMMSVDQIITEKYSPAINTYINQLTEIENSVSKGDWDNTQNLLSSFENPAFGRLPNNYDYPALKDTVQKRRNIVKDGVPKLALYMCANETEHFDDIDFLRPIVSKLFEAVGLFEDKYNELKRQKNSYDFSDIIHLALNLLVIDKDGIIEKTPLAKELSNKYEEILIDEFQDTNSAQNMLFWSLSKDENNLFMVGDVKQSIYRFRQAMPEIFIEKKSGLPLYENGNYPALINLDRNFRSRAGVVGFVNFVFSQLMSSELGDIKYDKSEELVFAADYTQKDDPDVEMHILDLSEKDKGIKNEELEAKYIAQLINNMMKSGFTVKDGDGERKAKYSDFCILLRGTKNRAEIYAQELLSNGIPTYSDLSGGLFSSYEIKVILSLLRVIDNPIQDIPLLSVLMSPIYGFSPDDVSQIRLIDRKLPLYSCVVRASENGDERCKAFLSQLTVLRRFGAALPAQELLRRIYDETSYMAIVRAVPDGEKCKANLRLLLDYAKRYEASENSGLSGFIRFIDKIESNSIDLSSANTVSPNANVVRIMSIHKSKGLEFPICIIAYCSGKFNTDSYKNMIIHPTLGVGLVRRDFDTMHQFETIPHTASKLELKRSEMSEEMRVLYVAMTRAKEKLITVISEDNISSKILSLSSNISSSKSVSPFAVRSAQNYSDWLLTSALRHPDAGVLRQIVGVDTACLPASFRLKVELGKINETPEIEEIKTNAQPNEELQEELKKRINYKYPYSALSALTTKRAASQIDEIGIDSEYFASSKPAFMGKSGLTPAQRGTATHKFMQFADYKLAQQNPAQECLRLKQKGFLSKLEAQAVDIEKISKFFNSRLAERIFKSDNVMREKKFAINISVCEFDNTLSHEFNYENILVQGIADCAFVEDGELVIVDYKTDFVKSADVLIERYKSQIDIYCRALCECTGLKVKEALLYSFSLGCEVRVN